MRSTRRGLAAGTVAAALAITGISGPPAQAEPSSASTPTVEELRNDSESQQRWLSVPHSRVVLNPYTFGSSGSELDQNSGADLPLSNAYYAHDEVIETRDVLTTVLAGDKNEGASEPVIYEKDFDSLDGWSAKGAKTEIMDDGITVTPEGDWGNITSKPITINASVYSQLTITVPSVEGMWSLKLGEPGEADDMIELQEDTSETGTFTYDLGAVFAEKGLVGPQELELRFWSSNGGDDFESSATISSLSIHMAEEGSFPDAGQLVAWETDFETTGGWDNVSANLSSDGSTGTLTRDGSYGYASTSIEADLSKTPLLSLRVADTTGEWALKVSDGGEDVTLQADTSQTGTFTYDLADTTGWSGSKEFTVKLYQISESGSTSTNFERLSIHSGGGSTVTAADSVDYAWTPAELSMVGHYGEDTVSVNEFFTEEDPNAYVRTIEADTAEQVMVAGAFEGSNGASTYDAANNVITIPSKYATRSIALPEDSDVSFYPSKSAFQANQLGTDIPSSNNGFWAASLPPDGVNAVGVGWAVMGDDASATAEESAASALLAADTAKTESAKTHWSEFWDQYLERVPLVQDFSIQRVADGGVTADEMRNFYYQGWIGLEMNILPETPETGNYYAQLGTGKPSMWMSGSPGTKNVASWDSLLGMQQLVPHEP